MKYFKFVRNRKVVDLLHYDESVGPTYVRFQTVHTVPLRCSIDKAEGILSDNEKIYNTSTFRPFPIPGLYPTVTMEEITENEYEQIKNSEFKTADEIREELLMELLERGIL